FVEKRGSRLIFRTDAGAPRGRVISVDLREPERTRWRTIVPESADTLESVVLGGGLLVASYLKDAHSDLRVFDLEGNAKAAPKLPEFATVAGLSADPDDPDVFFSLSTFTTPTAVWRHDAKTGATEVFRAPKTKFRPEDFVTEQVFATSKDGTRVPMFLS